MEVLIKCITLVLFAFVIFLSSSKPHSLKLSEISKFLLVTCICFLVLPASMPSNLVLGHVGSGVLP